MKKRILSILLACTLLLGGTVLAVPQTVSASPSASKLTVDGKAVTCGAYEIVTNANGYANTYFKLRDVAAALSGTPCQFNVTWDDAAGTIRLTTGAAYVPVGGEGAPVTAAASGTLNASPILLDGAPITPAAYTINQNNYFMLRDLGEALGFGVDWVQETRTIQINTAAPAPFDLNVCIASEPETLDPTLNRTVDGAIMADHLFEGLYKWVDDGSGKAVLAPGQVTGAPKKTVNADGSVTYTYTLRDDIKWSDGKAVTAQDFEYAWKRLVDPVMAAPYSYMLNMVKNANQIMAGAADPETLGVKASGDKTLVVELTYDCPYFDEICAFPTCMPVRQDVVDGNDGWFREPATFLCNGPYKMSGWQHNSYIRMEASDTYYDRASLGPDVITFRLMDDSRAMLNAFQSGELDYMQVPPSDEVAALMASGDLKIGDYLGTYYACFNNAKAPFDDARVRKAFSLAVDREFLVTQITQVGEQPAGAYVPPNIDDVGGHTGADFRTVGGDYLAVDAAGYAADCAEAKQLLADAGYPGGKGFPAVTYLFNTDDRHGAVALALQSMWKDVLGVDVVLDCQDWNVFLQSRTAGEYNICRNGWICDYNDPMNFLDMFLTGNDYNDAHYSNPAYDALVNQALVTSDSAKRMDLMHQAERLLIDKDAAVAPLYYYNQPYLLSDRVQGMYYTPLGYFFFMHCTKR